MIDHVIHKHHDKIDDIQKDLQDDIDVILKNIDIDAVIDNPQMVLDVVVRVISEKILDDYLQKAVEAGLEFSKEIGKAKLIKVEDTNDPKANEELSDKD